MLASNRKLLVRASVTRSVFFAACWWAMSEGDRDAVAIGTVAVTAAVLLSLRMQAPLPASLFALLRFLPQFLWRSLVGALDVAARALVPGIRISPSLVEYRTLLPDGLPRVVFANVVSLLPGTLSADLQEDRLCLHVLSDASGQAATLRSLERGVARIFPQR